MHIIPKDLTALVPEIVLVLCQSGYIRLGEPSALPNILWLLDVLIGDISVWEARQLNIQLMSQSRFYVARIIQKPRERTGSFLWIPFCSQLETRIPGQ
ncbi:CMGC/SRPK protein kinase [Fusarium oxysporum f. sp. albedinis]|nr:CMGC/SRPK protein kinase [Fusarium oxysporum f. sp. albedinis]